MTDEKNITLTSARPLAEAEIEPERETATAQRRRDLELRVLVLELKSPPVLETQIAVRKLYQSLGVISCFVFDTQHNDI